MKTLRLIDGDLSIVQRQYDETTGTSKVAQDLRGALLEPLGNDRFHPGWGSGLNDFIARIADLSTQTSIEAEVNRVIANYAAVQRDKIAADINSEGDTRFGTDEVLSRVQGVQVQTANESVQVSVRLRTMSGDTVVLTEAVG